MALALIYGCPGPRNLHPAVVTRILSGYQIKGDQIVTDDVPSWEIKSKLDEIAACNDEENFKEMIENFPER